MVSEFQTERWINMTTRSLMEGVRLFRRSQSWKDFGMFKSKEYCDPPKASDLIFKDSTVSLEVISKENMTYDTYLNPDTQAVWRSCEQLEPKPRAFICVVGNSGMKNCQTMLEKLSQNAGMSDTVCVCVCVCVTFKTFSQSQESTTLNA